MASFISQVVNGFNQSAVLLIAAMGLLIIFGLMNVINMAHGEMIMIGGFCAYIVTGSWHLSFGIAIIFAFLVTAVFGALTEILIIKRLYAKPTETILATYALSIILTEIARIIWPLSQNVEMPIPGTINIKGVAIPCYNIFVIAIAIGILIFTIIFFKRTKFGKEVGAITQNRQMAECLGIKTSRIDTLTFSYGAGLAGIAGCILAPTTGVSYTMGSVYLTDSFLTVVLGGVQSMVGVAASSGIMGEGRTILAGFLNETSAKIIIFMFVIVLLRFKPEGLFHRERR